MYEKLGSIKETVALSPRETLDSAALLVQLSYEVTQHADTSVTAIRHKREGMFGHSLQNLTVAALPSASPDRTVVNSYPLLYETTYLCASFERRRA